MLLQHPNGVYQCPSLIVAVVLVAAAGAVVLVVVCVPFVWCSITRFDNFQFAGVTHVGGDMFKSIPSGDAIFMKVQNLKPDYLMILLTMRPVYGNQN